MKTHTTNYTNTLIEIAEDSPVLASVIPVVKNDKKNDCQLSIRETFQTSSEISASHFALINKEFVSCMSKL